MDKEFSNGVPLPSDIVGANSIAQGVERVTIVAQLVRKWQAILFLHEWKFQIKISNGPSSSDDHTTEMIARIDANPVYLNATLEVFPCFFEKNDYDQNDVIVHELCHCHTQSVLNIANSLLAGVLMPKHTILDEVEILTQRMTNIAMQINASQTSPVEQVRPLPIASSKEFPS